jgi:hypothetical protein
MYFTNANKIYGVFKHLFKILFIVVSVAFLPRVINAPSRAGGLRLIASACGGTTSGGLHLAVLAVHSGGNSGSRALTRHVNKGGKLADVSQMCFLTPRLFSPFLLRVVWLFVLRKQA